MVGLLALALGGVPTWFWQGQRYGLLMAKEAQAAAEALATANQAALDKTIEMQRKKDAAIRSAETRAAAHRAAAAGAATESDSLRAQLAEARVQLSSAACSAVRTYADTLNQLFDQCQGRLAALARAADGHAADTRTLMDAWPTKE